MKHEITEKWKQNQNGEWMNNERNKKNIQQQYRLFMFLILIQ